MGRPFVYPAPARPGSPEPAGGEERLAGMDAVSMRRFMAAGLAASATFAAGPAAACTLCRSAPAASIRERLLAPDLWWNAAALVMPLLLLLSIVALVAREPGGSAR